ncbi:ABC transporter substrate-binding protein [Kitasatospora camelliae]|uniref:ABC transporter substrate-binding protein n=1 Tax=Kitasatospora camelliae TaxID=3156397 RepID=A0AAU8JU62_9ACTN
MSTGTIDTVESPHQRRVRRARRAAAALLVLAVLAAGAVLAVRRLTDDGCAPGVHRAGPHRECVGVTDGGYVFSPELAEISGLIRAENREAEAGGRYVSIAFLLPMTLTAADSSTLTAVREELQGAHTAQRLANSGPTLGTYPKIRLLLANSGSRSEQWATVTDRLIALSTGPDHLVAVAGFGQSLSTVHSAISRLRDAGIPTVGSTITADEFADRRQAGFFRVAPTNSDEGQAAATHLKATTGPGARVLVVADHNRDDLYSASLREGFTQAASSIGLPLLDHQATYLSTPQGTGNAFLAMKEDICVARPAAVYFAGRGRDLGDFVTSMAERPCLGDGPLTVLTGDDAVNLRQDPRMLDALQRGRLDVRFTALANPAQWDGEAAESPDRQGFETFRKAFTGRFPAARDLLDGQAMMGYDATLTAVLGIRFAAGGSGDIPVNPTLALQGLLTRTGEHSVQGASGRIDLTPSGNVRNKPMALLRLQPTGGFAFTAVVRPLATAG